MKETWIVLVLAMASLVAGCASTSGSNPPPPPGTLQVNTGALPGGTVNQAYSASLSATGGTTPYSWSVASGALPPGLSLASSTGQISGTPTQSGTFSFDAKVTDSNNQPAQKSLTITIAPAGSQSLAITTTSLAAGVVGQPYSATLQATGGTPSYTWSVVAGQLPAGLTLMAASGQILGTPSALGQFSFTVRVADSASPSNTATQSLSISVTNSVLDQYGGATRKQCAGGARSFFYVEKIGNRWWLCTPAGNVFWMRGVYNADYAGNTDANGVNNQAVILAKYGDTQGTWGPQVVRRLQSWGFNALAEYANSWTLPTSSSVKVPFTPLVWPSYYAMTNAQNRAPGPTKELIRVTKTTVYSGYRWHSPDVWDPNFQAWVDGALQSDPMVVQWFTGPNNEFMIGLNIDDVDWLGGFGAGPDFNTISNGAVDPGPWRNQPHLGWMVLITPPTQVSSTEFGVSYVDPKVYAKAALRDYLFTKYAGNIAALNSAWGSNYTTFDSAGGWGSGTGLLDEDGTHSWVPQGERGWFYLDGATAALKVDLDGFLYEHAKKYFCDMKATLAARYPGRMYLGPTTVGSWGTPARRQIYQAAAACGVEVLGSYTVPAETADAQARIDFIAQHWGDRPWYSWEGFIANPDSYFYAYGQPDSPHARYATQADRAVGYAGQVSRLLNAQTAGGNFPVVGFKFWEWMDNWGEQANWGLITRRDNAYDGTEAIIAPGVDPWGYPTGGENKNFGNFLGTVKDNNLSIYKKLLGRAP